VSVAYGPLSQINTITPKIPNCALLDTRSAEIPCRSFGKYRVISLGVLIGMDEYFK